MNPPEATIPPPPAPVLNSLTPNFLGLDNGVVDVDANGANFVDGDAVHMDSFPLSTVFMSATKLRASIDTDTETERNAAITVVGAAGTSASKTLSFIGG